jgi:hypothetical protein
LISSRTTRAILLGGLILGGLTLEAVAVARQVEGLDLRQLKWGRRFWEDTGAAIGAYLDARFPGLAPAPDAATIDEALRTRRRQELRDLLAERVETEGIHPQQFWKTIAFKGLRHRRPALLPVRGFEDKGRARLVSWGYRLVGGVAPFLLSWTGALVYLPTLAWACVELARWGRPAAAVVLPLLSALCPYVTASLTLSHSGMGMYLAALAALIGLSAYASCGTVTPLGLTWRALALGALWALCIACRNSAVMTLPGFLLAFAIGVARLAQPLSRRRGVALVVGLGLLFVMPQLALRDSGDRAVWFGLWEGLADFDRTKGHVWKDAEATAAYERAGHDVRKGELWVGPVAEPFFREQVLGHIREDPAWFAGIVTHRLWATLSFEKLWPRQARDGRYLAAADPQAGDIDAYYRLVPTVDWVGWGQPCFELPVGLFLVPLGLLLLLAALATALGRSASAHLRRSLLVPGCVALAALASPVVISTASGTEPQAIILVHFVAAGLLLDARSSVALRPPPSRAASPRLPVRDRQDARATVDTAGASRLSFWGR